LFTEILHSVTEWYLANLSDGGYPLVAFLMLLESTVIPIPSEVIIPAAAYLAYRDGEMSLSGIILAGTLGSWVGASLMYWASRSLGWVLLLRYGRYFGVGQERLVTARRFMDRYGPAGVFFARLLPVIRHLIGIPVGVLKLDFRYYSAATLIGSCLWCTVLAWLGLEAGRNHEVLQESLALTTSIVIGIIVVLWLFYYYFVLRPTRRD
jgi:membrane protein DedA with SNARE-associated domain